MSDATNLGDRIEIDIDHFVAEGLLASDSQAQEITNEFKVIKRPLLKNSSASLPDNPRANLWMVTSALEGEGKTFTSLNLALSVARERDYSVVLVDADYGKAHISRLFGVDKDQGFLDLLQDSQRDFAQCVRPTNVPGLAILPAGTWKEDTAELLSSSEASDRCRRLALADPRRILIFDAPPLLQTVEASILAAHVGQVVLVVRANKTPPSAVYRAYQKLDMSVPVNLVLTHADARDGINAYGAYYGRSAQN